MIWEKKKKGKVQEENQFPRRTKEGGTKRKKNSQCAPLKKKKGGNG